MASVSGESYVVTVVHGRHVRADPKQRAACLQAVKGLDETNAVEYSRAHTGDSQLRRKSKAVDASVKETASLAVTRGAVARLFRYEALTHVGVGIFLRSGASLAKSRAGQTGRTDSSPDPSYI